MRSSVVCAGLTLIGVLGAGCGSRAYTPAIEQGEAVVIQREIVESFYASRARVRRVGYRLRARAVSLCGSFRAPDGGLLLESPDRSAASAWRTRFDDRPTLPESLRPADGGAGLRVLYVVPESVLARHGVQSDDLLQALDGEPLTSIEHYNQRLLETRGRPVELRFERAGSDRTVRIRPPDLCSVSIDFSEDPGLMTFSQEGAGGSRVAVPFGLLGSVDDTFLAIAVAHQMAHVLIEFARDPVPNPEATADLLGLLIAAQAGFDVQRAPDFWEWLATEEPWRIASTRAFRFSRPHPWRLEARIFYPTSELHLGIAARLPAIRAGAAEIAAAQARR